MDAKNPSPRQKNQHSRAGSKTWAEATSLDTGSQIGWVGVLGGLVTALYWGSPKIELLFIVFMLAALAFFVKTRAPVM